MRLQRPGKPVNDITIVYRNYSMLRSTPQLLLVAENDGFVCGIVEIVSFPQVRPVDLPSPIRPDQQTEPALQAWRHELLWEADVPPRQRRRQVWSSTRSPASTPRFLPPRRACRRSRRSPSCWCRASPTTSASPSARAT